MRHYFLLCLVACCSVSKTTTYKPAITKPDASNVDASVSAVVMPDNDITPADIPVPTKSKCKDGMVEVKGDYCPNLEEVCLKFGDPNNKGVNGPVQCLEFKYPTRCLSDKTIPLDYCIDELPYPYNLNEKPATNMTWYSAKKICEDQGKRLCNVKEYRQACRGPENKPYPYGYTRQCDLCNCDRTPWLDPATHTFEQVDKRVPIKDILGCKSDYGVVGLVGNTDRWVHNEMYGERPYISGLVGGHPIMGARNRCSAITLAHGPNSQYYEYGQPLCCDSVQGENQGQQ